MNKKSKILMLVLSFTVIGFGQVDFNDLNENLYDKLQSRLSGGGGGLNQFTDGFITNSQGENSSGNAMIVPQSNLALDQSIDENQYYLATGDELRVYIWGEVNTSTLLSVDPEGKVLIPSVGYVSVKGQTLAECKEAIIEKMRKVYKKAEITVSLAALRKFRVYILGNVKKPGSYIANATTRVSDLLMAAIENESVLIRKRAVKIFNPSRETRTVDLAAFHHSSVLEANPYVYEGDRIFVEPKQKSIRIEGSVNYPGGYDFLQGDSGRSVLIAAGGFSRGADTTRIIVSRFVDNKDSIVHYEMTSREFYDTKLQEDDRILVSAIYDYRVHRDVRIAGEVRFPGIYPISKDKTTLEDILLMAGGLTEEAYLEGSRIVRKKFTSYEDREFERLKAVSSISDLSPIEKSYLKTKMVEENGLMSIDLKDMFEGGEKALREVMMRDGDIITIARKNLTIKITGAVVSPGLVSIKENAGIDYYIEKAGGYSNAAKKRDVKVIKGGTGVWLERKNVKEIVSGDAIFVPEGEYKDPLRVTKDVLTIVGSLATIVTTWIALDAHLQD